MKNDQLVRKEYRYILFDIDRTLLNGCKIEKSTFHKAYEKIMNKPCDPEKLSQITRLTTPDFFDLFQLSKKEKTEVDDLWGVYYDAATIPLFDGVKEVLEELKRVKKILGLVTSREQNEMGDPAIQELLKFVTNENYIVTSDMVEKPKPHPDSFEWLKNRDLIVPEQAIYIGDAKTDGESSKRAGIDFGHARWDADEEYPCEIVFPNVTDLYQLTGEVAVKKLHR